MIQLRKETTGSEILSILDVKKWLKVDYSTEDLILTELITQSREILENYLDLSLIDSVIDITTDNNNIMLPYPTIHQISTVVDLTGNTLEYEFNGFYITVNTNDTYKIIYSTKYDTQIKGIKLFLLEIIAYLYENRGDTKLQEYLNNNSGLKKYRNKVWI